MRGGRRGLGGLRWRWLPGDGFPALSERRLANVERRSRATVTARDKLCGADHPETLNARFAVVRSLHAQRRYEEAEGAGRALLADCRRVLGPGHRYTADAHVEVAKALTARGRDAEAEVELRAAASVLASARNTDMGAVANARLSLARTVCVQGRFDEAISLCHDVIAADEQSGTRRSTGMVTLANCHNIAGRFHEAERAARAVLDALPRLRSDRHSQALIARAHHDLGVALLGLGRYHDAETAIGMSLAAARSAIVTSPFLVVAHTQAAEALIRRRQYAAAEKHARDAVRRAIRNLEVELPVGCHARVVLAAALHGMQRGPEAEAHLRQPVLDLPAEHHVVLRARMELARISRARRRHAEAEHEARTSAAGYRLLFGPDHPLTFTARAEHAEALAALGRHNEARAEFRTVLEARHRVLGPDHPDTVAMRERLRRTAPR